MKRPRMWNVTLLIISIVYISCIYRCIIRYIPKNFDIPSRISFKFTISRIFYYQFKKQGYDTSTKTKKAEICKLKYEELFLKCQCEFDWYGYRTGTCVKCMAT